MHGNTPHGLNGALPSNCDHGAIRLEPITGEQLDAPCVGHLSLPTIGCRPDMPPCEPDLGPDGAD